MKNTAQDIRSQIARKNRTYLALRFQYDQGLRVLKFDPELKDRIVWIRNDIVELQSKYRNVIERKGVNRH